MHKRPMLALEVAEMVSVLESGRIAQTAPARAPLSDDRVRQAYLGVWHQEESRCER